MQEAAAALAHYDLLLLLDARRPVANFGYDGAPSQLVSLPVSLPAVPRQAATTASLQHRLLLSFSGCGAGPPGWPCFAPPCSACTACWLPLTPAQDEAVWEFDSWGVDLPTALALLADAVGGGSVRPGLNCGGVFSPAARPALPAGELHWLAAVPAAVHLMMFLRSCCA